MTLRTDPVCSLSSMWRSCFGPKAYHSPQRHIPNSIYVETTTPVKNQPIRSDRGYMSLASKSIAETDDVFALNASEVIINEKRDHHEFVKVSAIGGTLEIPEAPGVHKKPDHHIVLSQPGVNTDEQAPFLQ